MCSVPLVAFLLKLELLAHLPAVSRQPAAGMVFLLKFGFQKVSFFFSCTIVNPVCLKLLHQDKDPYLVLVCSKHECIFYIAFILSTKQNTDALSFFSPSSAFYKSEVVRDSLVSGIFSMLYTVYMYLIFVLYSKDPFLNIWLHNRI